MIKLFRISKSIVLRKGFLGNLSYIFNLISLFLLPVGLMVISLLASLYFVGYQVVHWLLSGTWEALPITKFLSINQDSMVGVWKILNFTHISVMLILNSIFILIFVAVVNDDNKTKTEEASIKEEETLRNPLVGLILVMLSMKYLKFLYTSILSSL